MILQKADLLLCAETSVNSVSGPNFTALTLKALGVGGGVFQLPSVKFDPDNIKH